MLRNTLATALKSTKAMRARAASSKQTRAFTQATCLTCHMVTVSWKTPSAGKLWRFIIRNITIKTSPNFNAAMEQYQEAEANDVANMIQLQGAIKFNGGGHVNHSIFWTNLAPPSQGGGAPPTGELLDMIEGKWGSLENFQTTFSATTAAVQGSGWGWLGYNQGSKSLEIVTCANQDPCSTTGTVPLLGVDVWEHAYYLDYKNVRPDYLKAIWKVVNWANVTERFNAAK